MGESKTTDCFSPIYQNILAQDNDGKDPYKTAATQRKCTVLSFEAASESLDNASSCDLLAYRLEKYTKTVYKDGENIYNSLLLKAYPNIKEKRQFKVPQNLPKVNLGLYLKSLECSDESTFSCNKSEKISKSELKQFGSLFSRKEEKPLRAGNVTKNKVSLQDRFGNLDKLQNTKVSNSAQHSLTSNASEGTSKNTGAGLNSFVTARDELENQAPTKFGMGGKPSYSDEYVSTGYKKQLGARRNPKSKFVSPLLSRKGSTEIEDKYDKYEETVPIMDARLKNIEPRMVELIKAEIMDQGANITWADIAGLEFAKTAIQEAVVWPMLRPDIFTGLRRPPKGILLFGPPGTGKTLIGKCVASQSKSTFFCISASSLTSKWFGDGEKMVRALFEVARAYQPAVIFIDEVDSLLTQRKDTEHECSRRIKTEFLVQLDGATTDTEERLLVIGATNRPQELDEAARRRFVKRLYIPLPEYQARLDLLKKLMSNEKHSLTEDQFQEVAKLSDGHSGADIKNLCSEAALGPIRSIDFKNIENIQASEVRPLAMLDFEKSLIRVRPSVSPKDLVHYVEWDKTYGSGSSA